MDITNRPALDDADLTSLRQAKAMLEQPGFAIQIANMLGTPLAHVLDKRLPAKARSLVDKATRKAIDAAFRVALATMKGEAQAHRPHNAMHKWAVAATGAAGGFFGLAGLPAELPVTTSIMLRSILDIARSEGESPSDPATRIACLEVLALGGSSSSDDAADTGYFAVRAALAQQVSAAIQHLASKGFADRGAPVMLNLASRIAAYFAIPVSEKALAEALPAIGAITGSTLNLVFIHHFQKMALGHFVVRRLERHYGEEVVRAAYEAL